MANVLRFRDIRMSDLPQVEEKNASLGQGPSDHPDFAQWLMARGIGSISLNADALISTWLRLADAATKPSAAGDVTTDSGPGAGGTLREHSSAIGGRK